MLDMLIDDLPLPQTLSDMMQAATDTPDRELTNSQLAARRMMEDSPKAFMELKAQLEREHWNRIADFHKRQEEEERLTRALEKSENLESADRPMDLGAEKVLEKLRELKERAENGQH